MLFIGRAMKIVRIIFVSIIVGFVIASTKLELRHLMDEGFWPGLVGLLICVGMIVVMTAFNARARRRLRAEAAAQPQPGGAPRRSRVENSGHSRIGQLLAAYPGPVTLTSSRPRWWIATVGSAVMTVASIFVCVVAFLSLAAGNKTAGIGIAASILCVALCGFATAFSARNLLAGALQLDRNGFQVTLFRRTQYLWTEVSDFRPHPYGSSSRVEFHAAKPRSRYVSMTNMWLGYSNDALPDTYGLEAEELADLMGAWQSTALDGRGGQRPLAPAEAV